MNPDTPRATDTWAGIRTETRSLLETRDYADSDVETRLMASEVVLAEELIAAQETLGEAWIPGVALFQRRVYHQRGRGYFAELARLTEGRLQALGIEPVQWSVATMYSDSAKGFHIHPPYIPEGEDPAAWHRRLYVEEAERYDLRFYEKEQWDVMFFIQGRVEIVLLDERSGLSRRVMRFVIDGDDLPGTNNAAVIVPPGVAHALRSCGGRNLVMVYGTTTVFNPEWEGRIASGVEKMPLPPAWRDYLER